MWAILTSKLGLAGIAAALVVGVIGEQTVRLHFADREITSLKAEKQAALDHAKVVEANAAKISAAASVANRAVQTRIEIQTRTIIKRIPAHVPPSDPHFYPWPTWSVLSYNAALGFPDASSGFDDSPSGLGAADAAQVFVANNGACRADQERLSGLQAWIRAQAANR